MKRFRTLLALILAFALVIGTIPAFAAADDDEEDEDAQVVTTADEDSDLTNITAAGNGESVTLTDIDTGTTVGKAVSSLVGLGIVNGYPDGTYRPSNIITRAEFTVVITKFLSIDAAMWGTSLDTGFADLDGDSAMTWAKPYVKAASDYGIINGFEDGTFRAGDPVTYEQAVKMIVSALGYGPLAESYTTPGGSWSSGYLTIATQKGILANAFAPNTSAEANRGTVAVLVYNSLEVAFMVANSDGSYSVDNSRTALASLLNQTKVSGIVTASYLTGIDDSNPGLPKNCIMVGNDIYEIGFDDDPDELLGKKISAYSSAKNGEDYPLLTNVELSTATKELRVDYDLIDSISGSTIYYFKNYDSEKTQSARVSSNVSVIYNGKYVPDFDIEDLLDQNSKYYLASGYIDFVCNNGDNVYEVVKVTSYAIHVVEKIDSTNERIYLMYDDATLTDFPTEGSSQLVYSMTRDGNEIAFTSLRKWDVLNILESPSGISGRRVYKVFVTRKTVKGNVTGADGTDPTMREIAGNEYHIAYNYLNYEGESKADLNVSDSAEVYLDCMDRIAAAVYNTTTTTYQYGYLIDVAQDDKDSDYDLDLYILNTSGNRVSYGTSNRITIDGKRYKTDDEDILDLLEETAALANESYEDAYNVRYHQPIRFATSSSNIVSAIDTIADSNIGDDLVCDYPCENALTYTSSGRSFGGKFSVSSSTKVFYIPDNRNQTGEYRTFTYSSAFSNGKKYFVEAYNCSTIGTAAMALMFKSNDSEQFSSSSPMMLVSGKTETVDGTTLKGYVNMAASVSSVTVSENCAGIDDIQIGDIIIYRLNTDREMAEYVLWFDASDPIQENPVDSVTDAIYNSDEDVPNRIYAMHTSDTEPRTKDYIKAAFRLQYGTVLYLDFEDDKVLKASSSMIFDDMDMILESNDADDNTVNTFSLSSSVASRIFMYNSGSSNSNKLSTGVQYEEISSYDDYPDSPTTVILFSQSGTLRAIYIIN